MSLQLAAQHMASRGRGPDTQLVHMAPQEVAGLQALAKAHGGSLTINPETGLAEAGFLKNLLPTLIGAGLSIASGGTLTPLMAAGITGAGYGVATGSLQKGLMAGLGAYGGAGLAGGLTAAAGTVGAGAGAAGAGASEMAATQAGLQQNALTSAGLPSSAAAGTGSMSFAPGMSTNVLGSTPLAGPMSVPVTTGQLAAGVPQVATATPLPSMTPVADRFSQAFQGVKNLGTEAGREAFMGNAASKGVAASGVGGGMGLMKSAYAAALPMMIEDPAKQGQKEEEKPYEYDFDYGPISNPGAGYTGAPTGERRFFNPRFTRRAADGGLMDLGTVQAMSDRNMAQTIAANGGKMFASGGSIRGGDADYYGDPDTSPVPIYRADPVLPPDFAPMPRFDFGPMPIDRADPVLPPIYRSPEPPAPYIPPGLRIGSPAVTPVGDNPYYTMSGQSGDAFKYLMGQTPTPRAATSTMSAGTAGLPAAGDTAEYDYTFDPITNRYSRTPKAVTPPAPVNPATGGDSGGSYDGGGGGSYGGGGYDDSFYSGNGLGSNNAPVENMGTDTGFGGMPSPAPVENMGTDLGFGDPSFSGYTGEVGTEGGYGTPTGTPSGGYTGEVGTEGGYGTPTGGGYSDFGGDYGGGYTGEVGTEGGYSDFGGDYGGGYTGEVGTEGGYGGYGGGSESGGYSGEVGTEGGYGGGYGGDGGYGGGDGGGYGGDGGYGGGDGGYGGGDGGYGGGDSGGGDSGGDSGGGDSGGGGGGDSGGGDSGGGDSGGDSGGDGGGWARGGLSPSSRYHMARGGLSALAMAQGGQVNLQGTFTAGDQGGGQFGQNNANGYQAVGSGGPLQGFSSSFGQMGGGDANMVSNMGGNTRGGIPGQPQQPQQPALIGGLSGYGDAMKALGNRSGVAQPQTGSYEQYLAGRSPVQQDVQMTREQLDASQRRANAIGGGPDLFSDYRQGHHGLFNDVVPQGGSGFRRVTPEPVAGQDYFARPMPAVLFANGGMASMARGGPSHLGDYSDGGRLLRGPGDGVSDSIPATIANKRPARLADGEFVVPARIVSELGNGSTEAGARKLYAMMDRIQKARKKSIGKNRVAVNSKTEKMLPA